jgi:hypothetical protein
LLGGIVDVSADRTVLAPVLFLRPHLFPEQLRNGARFNLWTNQCIGEAEVVTVLFERLQS